MKFSNLFTLAAIGLSSLMAEAQVEIKKGPTPKNDRDRKMNRLVQGDDNSFYAYRVRSKGKGTSYFVEKYSKQTLTKEFEKELIVERGDAKTKIEDVEYINGKVYMFTRKYFKAEQKGVLYYQTVASDGTVNQELNEIVTIKSDHFEFIDFDVYPNEALTKFVVKACHKPNKETDYKTDFILFDGASEKVEWTKSVNRDLKSNINKSGATNLAAALGGSLAASIVNKMLSDDIGYIGMLLDNNDNVYFGYTEAIGGKKEDESRYSLNIGVFNSGADEVAEFELKFDKNYYVKDIEFLKTGSNEIIVGGFIKDNVERPGRDLMDVGLFNFTIDLNSNSVKSSTVKIFDELMLAKLDSKPKKTRYTKYKLDYLLPIGDAIYFVGEQYKEQMYTQKSGYVTTTSWQYEYMDVIVAKLNNSGEFEWISNAPFRNKMALNGFAHVFKQYIAIPNEKSIYIMANDHPKNMKLYTSGPNYDPGKLKAISSIHGSDFVSSKIDLATGKVETKMVFHNEDYCFAPIQERNPEFIPPSDCEIFVPGKDGELYIYTEDKGNDQFIKLKIE